MFKIACSITFKSEETWKIINLLKEYYEWSERKLISHWKTREWDVVFRERYKTKCSYFLSKELLKLIKFSVSAPLNQGLQFVPLSGLSALSTERSEVGVLWAMKRVRRVVPWSILYELMRMNKIGYHKRATGVRAGQWSSRRYRKGHPNMQSNKKYTFSIVQMYVSK